jgi:hypothetical protein
MPNRRFLIISPSDVQQDYLCVLLQAILGPIDCARASTLEEGAARLDAWQPELVLVAVDLDATSEAVFFDELRRLRLDSRSLLLADVRPWLEWQWGPWANRVLLKGFSYGDLQKMVNHWLSAADAQANDCLAAGPRVDEARRVLADQGQR